MNRNDTNSKDSGDISNSNVVIKNKIYNIIMNLFKKAYFIKVADFISLFKNEKNIFIDNKGKYYLFIYLKVIKNIINKFIYILIFNFFLFYFIFIILFAFVTFRNNYKRYFLLKKKKNNEIISW